MTVEIQREKDNSELLREKKNKCTCSLGAKKIEIARNTGRFVFLLSPPHSLAATKRVEPQHFKLHRQGPTLGFCLPRSPVLLREILRKMTLKTTFAPVFCEKVQPSLKFNC